ncbi:putative remorin [Helianthus annuus]|nr:putative remorin [Helianthus annuus]
MFNDQIPSSTHQDQDDDGDYHDHESIREIHALTSPHPPPPPYRHHSDTTSHRSSSLSVTESENFTSMSREFNALVLAGTRITGSETSEVTSGMNNNNNGSSSSNLDRIGEDDVTDNNPLAIVQDNNPILSPPRRGDSRVSITADGNPSDTVSIQSVKREEVESKISAWQNAKIAKINNRFKREEAIINGWENEQVQKSSSWMNKIEVRFFKKVTKFSNYSLLFICSLNTFYVHGCLFIFMQDAKILYEPMRKLEEKRAHAMEKMQNDIAKARRKAEERRATSEAKRGTKVARVLEVANLMRAIGRAPSKRSFF